MNRESGPGQADTVELSYRPENIIERSLESLNMEALGLESEEEQEKFRGLVSDISTQTFDNIKNTDDGRFDRDFRHGKKALTVEQYTELDEVLAARVVEGVNMADMDESEFNRQLSSGDEYDSLDEEFGTEQSLVWHQKASVSAGRLAAHLHRGEAFDDDVMHITKNSGLRSTTPSETFDSYSKIINSQRAGADAEKAAVMDGSMEKLRYQWDDSLEEYQENKQ